MVRLSVRLAAVTAILAVQLYAQGAAVSPDGSKTMVSMPPAPLLPINARLLEGGIAGGFGAESPDVELLLKEDGLTRRETRAIAGPSAAHPLGWVKAYQFGDATGAEAAYTFYRLDALAPPAARIDQTEGVESSREIVFLNGVSVVRMECNGPSGLAASLRSEIEVGLPKAGGRRAIAPLLPTLFPAEVAGLKLDRPALRYALGPAGYRATGGELPADNLGWEKSVEAGTANYTGHGAHGTLTLLLYPTPQIAGERGRAIEKTINDAGPAKFGTVKLRRIGPLVGMASGALSPQQAEALVAGLSLHQEVTFDQKMPLEFHTEVRKTASLLQNIAVLSGVLILAALLLGLFLGGARAGLRVLMGKPAATEPEFLTINLRGQPKPLFGRAEDEQSRP